MTCEEKIIGEDNLSSAQEVTNPRKTISMSKTKMTTRIRYTIWVLLLSMVIFKIIEEVRYESPSPFSNETNTTHIQTHTQPPTPFFGSMLLHKFHIYVINDLPGQYPLDVHCRYKDINKGGASLNETEVFEFETRLNFIKDTKYWCHMSWEGGHLHNKTFWNNCTFLKKCNFQHCAWYARKDGLYLKNIVLNDYEKYYDWEKW